MQKEITRLLKIWYEVISVGHHKDRDCFWSIVVQYSYDGQCKYFLEHTGYLYETIAEEYKTLTGAQRGLIYNLKRALNKRYSESKNIILAPEDWDAIDLEEAQKVVTIMDTKGNA